MLRLNTYPILAPAPPACGEGLALEHLSVGDGGDGGEQVAEQHAGRDRARRQAVAREEAGVLHRQEDGRVGERERRGGVGSIKAPE